MNLQHYIITVLSHMQRLVHLNRSLKQFVCAGDNIAMIFTCGIKQPVRDDLSEVVSVLLQWKSSAVRN